MKIPQLTGGNGKKIAHYDRNFFLENWHSKCIFLEIFWGALGYLAKNFDPLKNRKNTRVPPVHFLIFFKKGPFWGVKIEIFFEIGPPQKFARKCIQGSSFSRIRSKTRSLEFFPAPPVSWGNFIWWVVSLMDSLQKSCQLSIVFVFQRWHYWDHLKTPNCPHSDLPNAHGF